MATVLAVFLAAALLGASLLFVTGAFRLARARLGTRGRGQAPAAKAAGACTLCGSGLAPGERLRSDITRGRATASRGQGERMMRIFGCPHCWPGVEGHGDGRSYLARYCPVCSSRIPDDGWAIARYFERPGRRHVHILGCTVCRPGPS